MPDSSTFGWYRILGGGQDEAKLEWKLDRIYFAEEAETCLCGHYPIKELCVIANKRNQRFTTVGNCCVKKFIGLPSNKVFQAIKRISKDSSKSLNAESIDLFYRRGWITEWENKFYLNNMRKRNLSDKQRRIKAQINQKVLQRVHRK